MIVLRLLRLLRGTVSFWIRGAMPEKLLNLCARKGLPVWGADPRPEGLSAETYARRYRQVSRLAAEAGLRTRIRAKHGLPFLQFRYRKRWGLPIGAAAACALLWYLCGHLWVITVSGCFAIDEAQLLASLAEEGLRYGANVSAIDPWELCQRMYLKDDRISWIAVNLRGATAQVIVSECTPPPAVIDPSDRYANVVASADGVIHAIEVYDGQALVGKGDTVSRGEVIVSGITQDEFGGSRLKYARAKVLAGVYEETVLTVPYEELVSVEDSVPVRARDIFILGKPLHAAQPPASALRAETRTIAVLYPLLLVRETMWFCSKETTISRTPFEAKEEAVRRLRALYGQESGRTLLQEDLTVEEGERALTLRAVCYVEKDIAEIREFSVG